MEKLIVYFKADEQELVCCNPFRVSSKKVAYVEAHFDLGENWTGYDSVRAIWRNTQNFAIIGTVLDSQGICKVPTEVLTSIGQVDVNLVGSISENNVLTDRLTTYPVEAGRVDANALVDGSETAEITPSQFEQFAAAVRNDAERAREGAEAAESYADAAAGSADDAAGSAQSAADDAARIAQMIQDVIEQIEDFYGVTVSVETLPAGSQATARYEEGHLYLGIPKGDKGDTGNGIASITKTGTSGLVDTYTITFTNGQTTTFAVTNGEKGDTGNGIASITKTGTSGLVDTYTIAYTDGQTETFTVTNGEKGDTGNGIDRIELTSTSGYVKTYTIYFTDGSTTTFEVTDGEVSLEDYYKQFIEDTASGSIASFPDGADDIPMISVLADIDPIQDLNGYDKPWSGGAGKNKFDGTIESGALDPSNGQKIANSERYRSANFIKVQPNTAYALSVNGALQSANIYSYGSDKSFLPDVARPYASTFTTSADTHYIMFFGTSALNADKVQLEKGSSATSWTPYSNICPISGHTECVTSKCGKDLYQFLTDTLALTSDFNGFAGWCNGWKAVDRTKKYTYSVYIDNTRASNPSHATVWLKDKNNSAYVDGATRAGNQISAGSKGWSAITIDLDTLPNTFYLYFGLTLKANGVASNPMVEVGTSRTDYEAYDGTTHTTSLGRTVYGGEVEVVGGSLTDKMGMVDLGSMNWIYNSSTNWFYTSQLANVIVHGNAQIKPNILSSIYETVTRGSITSLTDGITVDSAGYVIVKDSRYTDATSFKTAVTGQTLVYELAQPQTYQLTPQQINSLLGTNNVWADTGDVEVKYRADTKLYIDKVLAS